MPCFGPGRSVISQSPLAPGAMGSFGQFGVVQPQPGIALVMRIGLSVTFLILMVTVLATSAIISPMSAIGGSKVTAGGSFGSKTCGGSTAPFPAAAGAWLVMSERTS